MMRTLGEASSRAAEVFTVACKGYRLAPGLRGYTLHHAGLLVAFRTHCAGGAGGVFDLRDPGSGRSPDRRRHLHLFSCLFDPGALASEVLRASRGPQATPGGGP